MVEVGEVTICQKSLDATSASEKQFFHGFLVGTIQDFPGFKIDGYTRIGQTFQHHHIQINTSASVCMRLHEESASQCNGLFTEGGKVLTGRFHYRILFDHRTEKRNTEAKALFLSQTTSKPSICLLVYLVRSCFWSSIKQSSLGHFKCNQEADLT